jgi:hypothetical protein
MSKKKKKKKKNKKKNTKKKSKKRKKKKKKKKKKSVIFTSRMLVGCNTDTPNDQHQHPGLRLSEANQKYQTVFHAREETEGFQLTDIEEYSLIDCPDSGPLRSRPSK